MGKDLKILIDPQTFNLQKFGGISRYHAEVISALAQVDGVTVECPIVYSANLHLKDEKLLQNFRNFVFNPKIWPRFITKKISKIYNKKNIEKTLTSLKKQDFDVFVPTYYAPYFLETIGDKPFVLSVYDMIHEVLPQYFGRDRSTIANKKLLMEKATYIIAISESTKNDIISIYPHIDAKKIAVVYLSYSMKKDADVLVSLPKKYILFVGNRADYKNFLFFINAVSPMLISDSDLYVVCAGGNGFTSKEQQIIKNLGISKQLIQQNFKDSELAAYYSNAQCFVFPSEYEGFGIPVLEAMACGCPVVLSNHSSFPEVAGDAGIYFELNSEIDLQDKVSQFLGNEVLRNRYSDKGRMQAAKFNWQKTAAQSLEIYRLAARSKTFEKNPVQ